LFVVVEPMRVALGFEAMVALLEQLADDRQSSFQ
jgi:hypothetical protein